MVEVTQRFEEGVRLRGVPDHVPDVGITDTLMSSVVRASVDLYDTYGAQSLAGRNVVGLTVASGPARRALRIQAVEALRADL